MILYFSATGNSKYVAQRIAAATSDESISIVDCIREERYRFSAPVIGIVSPTYNWGLPSVTREFLKKADLNADYLFYTATYGTSPGGSAYFANQYVKKEFTAFFSVKMPDTWTIMFDLSTEEAVSKFTGSTEEHIDLVIKKTSVQESGNFMQNQTPVFAAKLFYPFYEGTRKTTHLSASEACIGCGLCAKKCPVQAIEIQNKRPVWVKAQCAMCLGCLHRCPKFAIQYDNGKATGKHGQYTNPHVKI